MKYWCVSGSEEAASALHSLPSATTVCTDQVLAEPDLKPYEGWKKRIDQTYKELGIDLHLGQCAVELHVMLFDRAAVFDHFYALLQVIRLDSTACDPCL